MVTKNIDLPGLLAETLQGLNNEQLGQFKKHLAEILPAAINQAAQAAKATEETNMSKATNAAMNRRIRGQAGQVDPEQPQAPDNQALLERAEIYVTKTGCSLREALDLVKAANTQPISPPEAAPVAMSNWIRKAAGK